MRYALMSNGVVINVVDQGTPPTIPGEWLACPGHVGPRYTYDGTDWREPAASVPQSVTPRQFRQALTRAGLRVAVESFIASADQDTKDWYEFSNSFERQNSVLIAAAHGLGKSDADIDALFVLAAGL